MLEGGYLLPAADERLAPKILPIPSSFISLDLLPSTGGQQLTGLEGTEAEAKAAQPCSRFVQNFGTLYPLCLQADSGVEENNIDRCA